MTLRLRRGPSSQLPSTSQIGEPLFTTDTGKLYIRRGDGTLMEIGPGTTGALGDGDRGDITLTQSGTVWTIDAGAVNTTKLGGDITPAGKALLDDASTTAQRATLGLGTAATANTGDFAAAAHGHGFSAITGQIALASQLPTPTAPGTANWTLRYNAAAGWQIVQEGGSSSSGTLTTKQSWWLSTQFLDGNQSGTLVDASLLHAYQTADVADPDVAVTRTWSNGGDAIRYAYFGHRFIGSATDPGWTPTFTVPGDTFTSTWTDCGTRVVGTNGSFRIWRASSQWPTNYSYPYIVS